MDEDAGAINQVQRTKIKEFRDLNLEPRLFYEKVVPGGKFDAFARQVQV